MTVDLVVVGAGGFGRETLDVVQARIDHDASFRLLGVIDDGPSELNLQRLSNRGVPYLGTIDSWIDSHAETATAQFVIAIGNPGTRQRIARRLTDAGLAAATVAHPQAVIGTEVVLGAGSVICGAAHISSNVVIGQYVHVNPNATIGHDTVVGDFVSVNPGSVVSGDVVVHEGVLIGAGSVILEGRVVHAGATIGASACVVRDVAAGRVVVGVPAR